MKGDRSTKNMTRSIDKNPKDNKTKKDGGLKLEEPNKEKVRTKSVDRRIKKVPKKRNKNVEVKFTESEDGYKAIRDSEKEKRAYLEKINLMKNHISALKRQQNQLNKRMANIKNKENILNEKKQEKERNNISSLNINNNSNVNISRSKCKYNLTK